MKKVLPILMLLAIFGLSKSIAQTFFVNVDFETGALPTGWSSTTATTGGQWVFGNGFTNNYLSPDPHTKYAMINDNGCNCIEDSARLTTPMLDISASANVFISYDSYYPEYHITGGAHERFYIQYSTNNGNTWGLIDSVSATGGWSTTTKDISAMVGSHDSVKVRFYYTDNGDTIVGACLDNIKIFAPITHDAYLFYITPTPASPTSYGVVNSPMDISGTIINFGTAAITSATIKCSDGTTTTSYPYSGNIAAAGWAQFTFAGAYTPLSNGPHAVKVWVELALDTDHANDTLGTTLVGVSFMPIHKVTFEEETGCWCGFCVRGIVYMDQIGQSYPTTTELIAVHDNNSGGDPMAVTVYETGAEAFPGFNGFPSVEVERKALGDPLDMQTLYDAHINDFGIADITVNPTFNWTTRALTVKATAHFAVNVAPGTGAYNLAFVITENRVHNTAATYAQHNYYSGGGYGALSNSEYDFVALPNVVPATTMYYDNVARQISGTYTGTTGSLAATIAAGTTVNYTFPTVYNVPATSNPVNMRVIVLLINTTTGAIMNANHAPLSPTGIEEINASLSSVNIYPNPFSTETNINFDLAKASNVTVTITNILGEVVANYDNGMMSAGEHTIIYNGMNLNSGLYFVTLKTGDNSFTQKISIQK